MSRKIFILWMAMVLCFSDTGYAYIGPGMSAGAIGVFLGLMASVLLAIVGVVWYPIKQLWKTKKEKKSLKTNYGFGSRLLHHISLGSSVVTEMSFDVEQAIYKPDPSSRIGQRHVFIAGFARAGTTFIMRRFYSTGCFGSLTYHDMPFALMPNLWNKMSALFPERSKKKERVHGDGILVDFDSPEALEEVFWRTFSKKSYIHTDKLTPMTADDKVIEKFRCYVTSIIARYEHEKPLRYLSKNNNNILRLHSILKAFPKALVLIPFRDPLQQADSLLRLHQRFSEEQGSNKFMLKYMGWLAHHECGLDHRPFDLGYPRSDRGHLLTLNYWLQQWHNVYQWLEINTPPAAHFVCYETLCENTGDVWAKLAHIAEIPVKTYDADAILLKKRDVAGPYDEKLLHKAYEVYRSLIVRTKRFLNN